MAVLDETIDLALEHYSGETARLFKADVFAFFGQIGHQYFLPFRSKIEVLADE